MTHFVRCQARTQKCHGVQCSIEVADGHAWVLHEIGLEVEVEIEIEVVVIVVEV